MTIRPKPISASMPTTVRGTRPKRIGQPASKIVSETCEAVDQARLSRAKTQHAIEQNRKSIRQILDLLVELRLQQFDRHPARKPVLQLAPLGDRFDLIRKQLERH
jgi:hypothetical protein